MTADRYEIVSWCKVHQLGEAREVEGKASTYGKRRRIITKMHTYKFPLYKESFTWCFKTADLFLVSNTDITLHGKQKV